MKRGPKLTYESYALVNGKKGSIFYTTKPDKDITVLACYHDRKVKTERLHGVNTHWEVEKLVKVTILK